MEYHHHELNFRRGMIEDDWTLDEAQDFDDIAGIEDLEYQEIDIYNKNQGNTVRRRIDDYLDKKRMKKEHIDTFDDDDYYYDDD